VERHVESEMVAGMRKQIYIKKKSEHTSKRKMKAQNRRVGK